MSEFVQTTFTLNLGTARYRVGWRVRLSVAFRLLKESAST